MEDCCSAIYSVVSSIVFTDSSVFTMSSTVSTEESLKDCLAGYLERCLEDWLGDHLMGCLDKHLLGVVPCQPDS